MKNNKNLLIGIAVVVGAFLLYRIYNNNKQAQAQKQLDSQPSADTDADEIVELLKV